MGGRSLCPFIRSLVRKEGKKEELSYVTNIQAKKMKNKEIDYGNTKGQHSIR